MFKPLKDKHKINVAMEKYYHWDDDVRSALEGFLNDLTRKVQTSNEKFRN